MSDELSEEVASVAREAAASVCWTQWVGLGSLATPVASKRPTSLIDPEALILLSLYLGEGERRLEDMVAWWAEAASRLTSLQRLRAVAERFPDGVGERGLATFAAMAAEAGDRRWTKAARVEVPPWVRRGKGPEEVELIEASALWPRLRAAFGVGTKADTLVFLIGLEGAWASAKVISFATGYSSVSVRKAAGEIALARLIRETEGRPVEYLAPPRPWAELLELYPTGRPGSEELGIPPWRFWSEIFAFLAGAIEWATPGTAPDASERVRTSRARDLIERHALAFTFNSIPVPPPEAFRGHAAAGGLLQTVRAVVTWMDAVV